MEKQSIYLIFILIILVLCLGVFWFQFNNDVSTVMILNECQVNANASFKGQLIDSYGMGVSNKTITYQKPDLNIESAVTDSNGVFLVKNAEYLSGSDNYYQNFTFKGDGKYLGCSYDGEIKVII